VVKLKLSLQNVLPHHDLVTCYGISVQD